MRDARYDILFEPVKIGPVTARNRFFQVPHCNGMGHHYPRSLAALRRVKAEGGWGVIATEVVEIHHTSDLSPRSEGRLWSDKDIPALALMTEAVHEFGSLAAIELGHGGRVSVNACSRSVGLGPMDAHPFYSMAPVQVRAMDKSDIRDLRRWHRNAALRARRAGFDIVYVYAGHDLSVLFHFLSRRHNQRSDEYGGNLENRARLLREVLEDTVEAVGESCGIALRFAVDELRGEDGILCDAEGRDVVEMLAEIPDVWDVNVSGWDNDSPTSRFEAEGYQQDYVRFVKSVTSKPVVGVGRFTSPDTMVSQIRSGVLDFIGAARASIADPFLPKKIEEGRADEIRECIGCNICVSGENTYVPIRCTQNPTMGEEWRRGWHPERIALKNSDDSVLIVGAGPAGLEAARALGLRGYDVTLAEATDELGGRVSRESRLPGLSEWGRVRDYRVHALSSMPNVEIYRDSLLDAEQVREFGASRVVIATGSRWRADGVGRMTYWPIPGLPDNQTLTPDDIMGGRSPEGPVIVYDEDYYYMASVLAEKLRLDGCDVHLVTPAPVVASWTAFTLEQHRIQGRLLDLGIEIAPSQKLTSVSSDYVSLTSIYGGKEMRVSAGAVVLVTGNLPNSALYVELCGDENALAAAGIKSVQRIGDCEACGTIAAAVYSGHLFAQTFDGKEIDPDTPDFLREDSPMAAD